MYAQDTIVAPATAPGVGAVAIIRLSGPRAIGILHGMWHPEGSAPVHPRRLSLGDVMDPETGVRLDRAMAVVMPGPNSFTGEDVAEMHCHGGPYLVRRITAVAVALGARLAEPGEFSRRAFLNGRMDLAEAEAISDLIAARGDAALRQALDQLSGGLSQIIKRLRREIIAIRAHLEVEIDFADEDIAIPSRDAIVDDIDRVIADVASLHDSFARGRIARDGARAAIIGKPNVGKSSLLNAMLGTDRAIVTATPGTTRDVIEDMVILGQWPLTVLDTAGIRASRDEVERLGIERSRRATEGADLIIAVFDGSRPIDAEDAEIVRICAGRAGVAVLNKSDLPRTLDDSTLRSSGMTMPTMRVSALTSDGISDLRHELTNAIEALAGPGADGHAAISRDRHRIALSAALEAMRRTRESLVGAMPPEIVAVDIAAAAEALGAITGAVTDEDVLDAIFREFCIGK